MAPTPSRIRAAAVAAATLAALAAAVAPASADSIAYVKDANVFLTTPDGARQVQLTIDGGYSSASQADDGTLVALHGRRLRRLDRAGRVLADFATPVSETQAGSPFTFTGPIDPQVSPDGRKVAYGYTSQYTRWDPYCGAPGGCSEGKVLIGTGYSHADRATAWDEPGFGRHTGWMWPSWIDDTHVLISDVAEILNQQVWIDTFGDGQNGMPWFQGTNVTTVRDGELNRQGNGLALVASVDRRDNEIRVYRVTQPAPSAPALCLRLDGDVPFRYASNDPGYSSPSWSPDGRSLAYDNGVDLFVASGLDLDGCSGAQGAGVVIPGAHDPDWGPADVPPSSAATPAGPAAPRPHPSRARPRRAGGP